jgi:hypothetical protein
MLISTHWIGATAQLSGRFEMTVVRLWVSEGTCERLFKTSISGMVT